MKTKLFAAALFAAAAIPAAAQAVTYSAIALSQSTGAYGFSYDQGSQGRANRVATDNCSARDNGAGDCRVVQYTHGAYCAALVINHTPRGGSVGWGAGSAASEGEAKRIAWRECQVNNHGECDTLAASVCSH